ncbi:dTDP-4-dehydrorhamnose reductase [Flavobacterium myungsuense]|uniref:dTDP-4-dehydrorhamnose reductase n=1 Tax=Flavobacterium myungsuense TaxID=651823 RepID=A0ABW3J5N3_9FLAO
MVVLVTGANGQLGQSLQFISEHYSDIQFHFYTSTELDITDNKCIREIFTLIKPHFCINAAAYTAVDKAEAESEKAVLVNVTGAKNIALICNEFSTVLIHVSTDFVFDGIKETPYTEEDTTNPQGVYGKTKREGEIEIIKHLKHCFIVRTSWLYSSFGNNFMKTMLKLANERNSLNVVNDQIGTPTHAVDLAQALVKIVLSGSQNFGIYHYSNEGKTSWYGFAKEIFNINKTIIDLNPIPTSEFPTPAKRPKYSVLDKSKIKTEFGISINDWKESLRLYK